MPILLKNNKIITAGGKILTREATPFDLPNLKLYLSANRMAQLADGTAISNFLDYSGNNYHATQATGSSQPLFKTSQFSSNAGIKFDGIDDRMDITGGALDILKNVNQWTFQVLMKRNVVSETVVPFSMYDNTSTTGKYRLVINYFAGDLQMACLLLDSDTLKVVTFPSNDTNGHLVQTTLNPTTGNMECYNDGLFVGSVFVGIGNTSNTSSGSIKIGYVNGPLYTKGSTNGVTLSTSYSNPATIQAQYRGYLQRGYL